MPRPKIPPCESLKFLHPEISSMWYLKDNPLIDVTPEIVGPGANDEINWRCKNNHIERRRITDQVKNSVKCYSCTYLPFTHPKIFLEIDKNNRIDASKLTSKSKHNVQWKCTNCNHRWKDKIKDRCKDDDPGCRKCAWGRWQLGMLLRYKRELLHKSHSDIVARELIFELSEQEYGRTLLSKDLLFKIADILEIPHEDWLCWYEQALLGPPKVDDPTFQVCSGTALELSRKSFGCQKREFQKILQGNSIKNLFPSILSEWDYANNPITPTFMSPKSSLHAIWICKNCNHQWSAWIANRTRKKKVGCPECGKNKRVLSRRKTICSQGRSLQDFCPFLSEELIIQNGRQAKDIPYGSTEYQKWRCSDCNHIWTATVNKRTSGRNCPKCWASRRYKLMKERIQFITSRGHNIGVLYPELAQEFDTDANAPMTPFDIPPRSSEKYWWRCPRNNEHLYDASPAHRTQNSGNGTGCPYCSHNKPHPTYNLSTERPSLVAEWDWEKNKPKKPEDYLPQSTEIIWWFCDTCNSSYKKRIGQRYHGVGCGNCSIAQRSTVEIKLAFELQTIFTDINPEINEQVRVNDNKIIKTDILIESERLVIEYDGHRYHDNPDKDMQRIIHLENKGYKVLSIRENPLNPIGEYFIIVDGQKAFRDIVYLTKEVLKYLKDEMNISNTKLLQYLDCSKPKNIQAANSFIQNKKQRYS